MLVTAWQNIDLDSHQISSDLHVHAARWETVLSFARLDSLAGGPVDIALWWLHDTTGAYGETVGGLQV